MRAAYYAIENGHVRCNLCPHHCLIKDGQTGLCRVRRNVNGTLQLETYGRLSAIHLDPIEKKPLYHFYPGSRILSVGSVGCNMNCKFCQNCDISQVGVSKNVSLEEYSVDQLVYMAHSMKNNIGIAFTYNEPTIFYEYMIDVSQAAHLLGMKTAMITNGYIEAEPLKNLLPFIDAFNVDLKAFTDSFYRKHGNARLEPVKETLRVLRNEKKHFEVTNLIIPDSNDSVEQFTEMVEWIHNELGKQTILHLSKYFPRYEFTKPATSDSALERFFEIAKKKLDYVYLGNVSAQTPGHHTECPKCGTMVVQRNNHVIDVTGLDQSGACLKCSYPTEIFMK